MSVKILTAGPLRILMPTGEIRRETSEDLALAIDQAVSSSAKTIVISFRDVTALLSEGIRRLVTFNDHVKSSGKTFHVTDLPPDVRYTLKITNLLDFLNHVEALDKVLGRYSIPREQLTEFEQSPPPSEMPAEPVAPPPVPSPPISSPAPAVTPSPKASSDVMPKPAGLGTAPAAPAVKPPSGTMPRPPFAGASALSAPNAKSSSGVMPKPPLTPTPTPAPASAADKAGDAFTEQDMQKMIQRHLPGRMAVEIVQYFSTHRESVASVAALAKALGVREGPVRDLAKELTRRGVLKTMGADLYNYAPEVKLAEQIQYFLRQWRTPGKQPRLLAMLLAAER